jgi:Helix-turn-helix domain
MPAAKRDSGDPELAELFDRFEGHLVTPSGAVALLGVSRQTIHTLCARGQLRGFRGPSKRGAQAAPSWTYIPLSDIRDYAIRRGRSNMPMEQWGRWLPREDI